MTEKFEFLIRNAKGYDDLKSIQQIYKYYVDETVVTFAESHETPTVADFEAKYNELQVKNFPFIVAVRRDVSTHEELVVGYAYLSPFRPRSGWRFTLEDSIYLHHEYHRKGLGKKLLSSLIEHAKLIGCRNLIASISADEPNGVGVASMELHSSFGFQVAGRIRNAGLKFDRWIDCVFMELCI
jgi:L-amino acid N-acyltransferase YncA